MNLLEYQQSIVRFVRYPKANEREYLALGLVSEIGELSGKFAKRLRGDTVSDADVIAELGDALFFVYMIRTRYGIALTADTVPLVRNVDEAIKHLFETGARVYAAMNRDCVAPIDLCVLETCLKAVGGLHGCTLDEIAEANYQKLSDRATRGVIIGSGDAR